MRKRLTTIGSSLGIIIDKPILDLLNISAETELDIETDGRNLVLRPVRSIDQTTGLKSYQEVAKRHRKSLKKLAR